MDESLPGAPASLQGFVHRFVPGREPGAPALLLLHGTGGDENDLLPLGRMLSEDAPLLSPRGRVVERGMPRFFRRLAEGVFDVEDLRRRTRELAGFVAAARDAYELEERPIVAVGFSNGANIAASLLLLEPGALDGAILLRAVVPFEPDSPPRLERIPVLIAAGRNDPIAPPAMAERLAGLLHDAGAEVTLEWDDGGHSIGPSQVRAARAWLARAAPRRSGS